MILWRVSKIELLHLGGVEEEEVEVEEEVTICAVLCEVGTRLLAGCD